MKLFELQQAIKNHKIPKFLIFTGNEYAIIELYIQQICKQFNLMRQNVNAVDQIIKPHAIMNILKTNTLYVCRYDNNFVKQEGLWKNIDAKLTDNYFILILSNIDNRSKLSKYFEKRIVEFSEQTPDTVALMIGNLIKLSKAHLQQLMVGCKYNYSKLTLEIDKIKTLSAVRNITQDEAYELLLKDGAIIEATDTKLQEFIDCVMNKKRKCFKLYENLIENGETNLVILAWLYNAVRNQLSVQTVSNPTAETTGLNFFFIKECLSRKGIYTTKELLNMLSVIKFCEQGMKNGNIDQQYIIDYILVNAL